ncbi:hypothetical protein [Pseudophaeobacter flagellatus]|uniref:hypothetical protein n=1 Tax=Pseudophaeobacter flagellatus TaxID=2899119 RepID=UPI001E39F037|nr:hypothetical protein [Pseudophaeobacter flagellatus]MCD9148425.1 hypothetical protein [Pseudophaeobacter flagellatus]
MIKFIKNFRKDDSGAVTVDWVVLTAAVAALAGAAYTAIESATDTVSADTATFITRTGSNTVGVDGANATVTP